MSLIHVARDNAVLGQFTEAEIRAGLANGTYLITDLAWKSGRKDWAPLGSWPEFTTGTPPPIPGGARISGEEMLAQPPAGAPPPATMPAWERDEALSAPVRVFTSIKEVLLRPTETFAGMPHSGGFGRPFGYYMIPQVITGLVMGVAMAVLIGGFGDSLAENPQYAAMVKLGPAPAALLYFAIYCVGAPIGMLLWSLIQHALLKLWGSEGADHECTFRVLAYTHGSIAYISLPFAVLSLIPVIGMLFQMAAAGIGLYAIVLQVIGFMQTHRMSAGRAIAAVLTPILLCCCLAGFGLMAIITAAAAAHK